MSAATLACALTALISAQGAPELVVVPLQAEGVRPQEALDAWRIVSAEFARAQPRLKISMKLHKELHDVLLGPAREQAQTCGDRLACVQDVGRALEAGEVVVGRVTPDEVTLLGLSVETGQLLGTSRTSPQFRRRSLELRARSAAQVLITMIRRAKIRAGVLPPAPETLPENAVAEAPVATPEETAEAIRELVFGETSTRAEALPSAAAETAPLVGGHGTELKDSVPLGEVAVDAPAPESAPADAAPPVSPPGSLRVSSALRAAYVEVEVDGEPVRGEPDGSATWTGPAGAHVVVAERSDHSRVSFSVLVEAGRTIDLPLPIPPAPPPPAVTAAPEVRRPNAEKPVSSRWWFWAAIATAVLAGGATTVVLAGGLKGGPSIPNHTGSVTESD